jgi:hypothetical protein
MNEAVHDHWVTNDVDTCPDTRRSGIRRAAIKIVF